MVGGEVIDWQAGGAAAELPSTELGSCGLRSG